MCVCVVFAVFALNQVRYLFSAEELGIKKYEESRQNAGRAVRNHDFFKQTMSNRLTNPKYELLLLESDLRTFVHLMTNSRNDIAVLKSALHQLVKKRRDYDGDKYRIGTILMRMCSFLKLPDEALMVRKHQIHFSVTHLEFNRPICLHFCF